MSRTSIHPCIGVLSRKRLFLFLSELISYFFYPSWWFHEYFGKKSWNQSGFIRCEMKIIWNHLVTRLGPRTSAPRNWFQYFFALHEYHTGFQDFLAKIVLNTTMKVKKNNELQVKKNRHGFDWNPTLVIFRPKMLQLL